MRPPDLAVVALRTEDQPVVEVADNPDREEGDHQVAHLVAVEVEWAWGEVGLLSSMPMIQTNTRNTVAAANTTWVASQEATIRDL